MAASAPSTSVIKVSQRPDNPHAKLVGTPSLEHTTGGGISIKQRLGIGALAPTNPKTGPPPVVKFAPPRPRPSALANLKINKKTPSLDLTSPSLGSPYDAPMYSPHSTSNLSPNTTNLTPSTSAPVSTANFPRPPAPFGTMYVLLFYIT